MEKISRKWERIIAWVANVIMILASLLMWAFTTVGFDNLSSFNPQFKEALDASIRQGAYNDPLTMMFIGTSDVTSDAVFSGISFALKVSLILMLVSLVFGIIASFTMFKRKFSATLFIVAGIFALPTIGFFTIVFYWLVALLLFIRKDKVIPVENI